jgi:3-hydroxyacyl-CoA dehydrogenase / enoyl-CoA hydratase / 3-hydroxybutyryl-CoA epimerase
VIEAVFESVPLKQQVFQQVQDIVEPGAVLGSNTSTLPITLLAAGRGSSRLGWNKRPCRPATRPDPCN